MMWLAVTLSPAALRLAAPARLAPLTMQAGREDGSQGGPPDGIATPFLQLTLPTGPSPSLEI